VSASRKLEEMYRRYRENLSQALSGLKLQAAGEEASRVREIVELAESYRRDAEHFQNTGRPVTALISLAYGEGLLDALRLLRLVHFTWKRSGAG